MKSILLGMAIIITIFISGCISDSGQQSNAMIQDCLSQSEPMMCISDVAAVTNDPSICNDNYFKKPTQRNSCLNNIAAWNKNPEICFQAEPTEEGETERAIDGCLSTYMYKTNLEACHLMKNEEAKYHCYIEYHKCDMVPDDFEYKQYCKSE